MVKTRHCVEVDGDSPNRFLSLEARGSKPLNDISRDTENSDDSGVANYSRHGRRTRKLYQSEVSTTSGQRKRKNTCRSSDEEVFQQRLSSRLRRIPTKYDGHTPVLEEDDPDSGKRRSTRQRRFVYGTFNQKLLDKALYMENDGDVSHAIHFSQKRKQEEPNVNGENQFEDMYSRVKRKRRPSVKDMYGIPTNESGSDSDSDSSSGDSCSEEDGEGDGEEGPKEDVGEVSEEEPEKRSYFLREHKPRTQLFEAGEREPKFKKAKPQALFRSTPPRSSEHYKRKKHKAYRSPAHRRLHLRRRAAFHGGSSSTSSSSSSSDSSDEERFKRRKVKSMNRARNRRQSTESSSTSSDSTSSSSSSSSSSTSSDSSALSSDEERFERRKAKSMVKARNRCLPMNMTSEDIAGSGILRDRVKIGSSLADVDPMNIDKSVNFDSVGGLGKHVRALKEMIVFPLLYPEVFERFKISPPRGVLFYGPPGTGKTLVARALTNECSTQDRRVSFFMRKGADCLSKWVGESERQLRLLFDQAYQMRPSIIFFDEIDGLAPVRSSRQDQIHSSIVSTLLALMDGLDTRGEIIVIGATNRIDSIDPALRRPGRFDREFLFPLPSVEARKQIFRIHTKEWKPPLSSVFVAEVAKRSVGYCGADMKALCTEAALLALRRRYPQIYTSSEKLQIDVSSINIGAKDFFQAIQSIVPTSQRAVTSPARSLPTAVEPLMGRIFSEILDALQRIFPNVVAQLANLDVPATAEQEKRLDKSGADPTDEICSDDDDDFNIYERKGHGRRHSHGEDKEHQNFSFKSYAHQKPTIHRPRLLLAGHDGQGQSSYLAPAVLHHLEQLPVHTIDLPSLFAVSAKTPEEACAQIFHEARRTSPSIIYMPHINQWWDVLGDTLRATFLTLVQDLDPSSPILLMATSDIPQHCLDERLRYLFDSYCGEVICMSNPTERERRQYFSDLLLNQAVQPPVKRKQQAMRILEILPRAPPPEARKLTEKELAKLYEQEEVTLRELRLFLRDVLNKLGRDRKFGIFTKPVDMEDVPDYYEIIKQPMDLCTMMSKIDLHNYLTVTQFLTDIDLICMNALEYNPVKDSAGRAIRHRACALRDTANAIVKAELDTEFEKICEGIADSRKRRGLSASVSAPQYYHTLPPSASRSSDAMLKANAAENVRCSRRIRGLQTETQVPLDMVEKQFQIMKSLARSPIKDSPPGIGEEKNQGLSPQDKTVEHRSDSVSQSSGIKKSTQSCQQVSTGSSHKPRPKKKCIWSSTKRRRRKPLFAAAVRPHEDHESEEETDDEIQFNLPAEKIEDSKDIVLDQEKNSPTRPKRLNSPQNRSLSPRNRSPQNYSAGTAQSKLSGTQETKNVDQTDIEPQENQSSALAQEEEKHSRTRSPTSKPHAEPVLPDVDSGISSSVDSNGDSLDSMDQAKAVAGQTVVETNTDRSQEVDNSTKPAGNKGQSSPDNKLGDDASSTFRLTRSRIQTKQQQRAIEILEEVIPPVIVDRERLVGILDKVVCVTKNYNIERLEKVYSLMSHIVFHHRKEYDKTAMIQELEDRVTKISQQQQ